MKREFDALCALSPTYRELKILGECMEIKTETVKFIKLFSRVRTFNNGHYAQIAQHLERTYEPDQCDSLLDWFISKVLSSRTGL